MNADRKGFYLRPPMRIDSGAVFFAAIGFVLLVLFATVETAGWVTAWNWFGVPAMLPPFADLHLITDSVPCAAQGIDVYVRNTCAGLQHLYNYPPVWLLLGQIGVDRQDTLVLYFFVAAPALVVLVMLVQGRSRAAGLVAALALISPSVMLAFERGNTDLVELSLVGAAALSFSNCRYARLIVAFLLVGGAIVLKIFPAFCVSLLARFNKVTFVFVGGMTLLTLGYLASIYRYVLLIRTNTPQAIFLSYGYKVAFLSLDSFMRRIGISTHWGQSWVPLAAALAVLVFACGTATIAWRRVSGSLCPVSPAAAGTAFLFGAGIYCGTFMLATNFAYRLIFLLLCLPQLFDWLGINSSRRNSTFYAAQCLLVGILLALWLNGFHLVHWFILPAQVIDWLLFAGFAVVLATNFLSSSIRLRPVTQPAEGTTRSYS